MGPPLLASGLGTNSTAEVRPNFDAEPVIDVKMNFHHLNQQLHNYIALCIRVQVRCSTLLELSTRYMYNYISQCHNKIGTQCYMVLHVVHTHTQGDFVNNEYHGTGTYTWPDGSSYTGDFVHSRYIYSL